MKKSKDSLSQQELQRLIHYDPDTGLVRRLVIGHRSARNGGKDALGYVRLFLAANSYRVHRLAFLYMTGQWSKGEVDHINGDPSDNRWCNLRDVSHKANIQNQRRANAKSSTGLIGAARAPNSKIRPFKASIRIDGRFTYLGAFATAEEAHRAYVQAKREHHEGCTL